MTAKAIEAGTAGTRSKVRPEGRKRGPEGIRPDILREGEAHHPHWPEPYVKEGPAK